MSDHEERMAQLRKKRDRAMYIFIFLLVILLIEKLTLRN